MRQAILTKHIGPTNTKGSRVKASADAGSITASWDYALNIRENHQNAALALAKKLGWDKINEYIGGSYKNGYVFVAVPKGDK